jgi:4-amino-4-deoxy-L-arabinose transferase-like glycosyltransferase
MNKPEKFGFHLTLEHLLYGLILTAAAILRLANLGRVPLSPAEATEALAVWQLWRPVGVEMGWTAAATSPAYLHLTALLSQLIGYSDSSMRLVPALLGLATVALPWFLRSQIGRSGALFFSLFLALSPIQIVAGRTAGGESIAIFALVLLLVSWLRYQDSFRRLSLSPGVATGSAATGSAGGHWLYTAVIALALGVNSDPIFYSGLLGLVLAWIAQAYLGPALLLTAEGEPQPTIWPETAEQRTALGLGAAVLVGVATLGLTHLAGIGITLNVAAGWLARFGLPTDLLSWLTPVLSLGRYELAALLLGGTAVVWTTWRGAALPNFFVYWLTALLALTLLQAGVLSNILSLSLPLYLLTAVWLHHLFALPAGWEKWPLLGGVLLVGGIVVVNLARYGRVTQFDPEQTTNLIIVGLALAFLLLVTGSIAAWDRNAAGQGLVAGLLICLLVFNFGAGWRLGQAAANDPREHWVEQATDDSVRWLADQLHRFSRQFARSETGLSLFVTVESPVLRWYLRDFSNVQYGPALPAAANQQALITPDIAELGRRKLRRQPLPAAAPGHPALANATTGDPLVAVLRITISPGARGSHPLAPGRFSLAR